ncbi:hypothetical protein GOODEAATRI_028594 [Goodea atripinnis]|uniref:Uncharacterized protein n=1 Tax=Goodea atripinnis TaxID=208336 RepID=A0ABV0PI28_9TELE
MLSAFEERSCSPMTTRSLCSEDWSDDNICAHFYNSLQHRPHIIHESYKLWEMTALHQGWYLIKTEAILALYTPGEVKRLQRFVSEISISAGMTAIPIQCHNLLMDQVVTT